MSKNIGILTIFNKNYNYGGVLQAYALTYYLNDMGYKAEQINLVRPHKFFLKKIFVIIKYPLPMKLRLIKKVLRRNNSPLFNKTIHEFNDFFELIPHTSEIYVKDIKKNKLNYDVYISGSDQVWNLDLVSREWLFSFLDDKHIVISYAASIAKDNLTKSNEKVLRKELRKYHSISVREKHAREQLIRLGYDKTVVVADPTILIGKEVWDSLIINSKIEHPKRYLLVYLLGTNKNHYVIAQQIALKLGLSIFIIKDPREINDNYESSNNDVAVGPIDFISLIKNSDYVITDSFHATIFSIIYEKQFMVVNRYEKSYKGSINSRLQNLLELCEIEGHILGSDSNYDDYLDHKINYVKVRGKISEIKRYSIDFIKKSLEILEDPKNE